MKKAIYLNKNLTYFGLPLILFGILIFIMKTSFLAKSNVLNLAISLDLLLTIPLIYYILIRKSKIPKTTVVPVLVLGIFIGSYLLPPEHQTLITLFKTWVVPIIEISILFLVFIKVRLAIKKRKTIKGNSLDFFDALKSTCQEILPRRLVMPFATELAVFYYGFIHWKKPLIQENQFTYHKKSGTPALLGVFIFIIGIETLALHFLFGQWSVTAAWILSGLSIYTALQVFGFARSLSKRPISFDTESLHLKYGIMNEVKIPYSDINKVELSWKSLKKNELTRTLSILGEIERHNIVIHLSSGGELIGLYGLKKKFKVIALHVDEPKLFKMRLDIALNETI